MALAPIAERAGLSRQAVVSRYRDRSEVGADLWTTRLAPHMLDSLTALVNAGTDSVALRDAFAPFIEPDMTMQAAAELLVVARYDAAVATALEQTMGPTLDQWLTPTGRHLTRVKAAQHAYLLVQALGLLMQARRFQTDPADLNHELDALARALAEPTKPRKLPADSLEHLDRPVEFGTGDPDWEQLLRATLTEVGTHGYEGSTLDVIARAAGCTQGLIYSRYETKHQLFFDATDRMAEAASNAGNEFWRSVAQIHSEGIAQATMMREYLLPSRKGPITVYLEQCRLSWHDEELLAAIERGFADAVWQIADENPGRTVAELRGDVYSGIALGYGVSAMNGLHPEAWRLPLDVVTVPLMDR